MVLVNTAKNLAEEIPGCPACKKRLYTASQFVEHLANDVLPGIIEDVLKLSAGKS